MALGFLLGGFGHLIGSNAVISVGILLVFLATVVLPLVIFGNPY